MVMNVEMPLDPSEYSFWLPPEGMTLTVGDDEEIDVPQIPLPILAKNLDEGRTPSERVIGEGLNSYLRRFPDCPNSAAYAEILKQAYPFHVSDLGSEIIILDVKNVEPELVRDKIKMLKVFALMEPENFGVLQQIGIAYYDLAMVYSELIHVRREMGAARLWLEKARRVRSEDLENLNYLAQICYFAGGYPQAKLYWRLISDALPDGDAKDELLNRISRIENGQLPAQPLMESLEQIGVAMEHYQVEEYAAACEIMERLQVDGSVPNELPNPEFYYFLGLCREQVNQQAEACEAFNKALELDPKHQPSQEAIDRLQVAAKEG